MATVQQYTDPYIATYRRVPPAGDGVCTVCYSGPNDGYPVCYSCTSTMGQVARPVSKIVPISLYEVPDQYWNTLRFYKDGKTQQVRDHFGTIVAATIARFVATHWNCISGLMGGTPTVVTTVPSTGTRSGEHPLAVAVKRTSVLSGLHKPLLERGPGQVGHNLASDNAFVATANLRGSNVLLIEDTFTTGARTQSAASSLYAGGARSVAVVVAGRVVKPTWNNNCQRIWDYACQPFTFDTCCLCSQDRL